MVQTSFISICLADKGSTLQIKPIPVDEKEREEGNYKKRLYLAIYLISSEIRIFKYAINVKLN